MNNPDDVRYNNPYPMQESIAKLRFYLKATLQNDGLELLEKAVTKADEDSQFARDFENAILFGVPGTVQPLWELLGKPPVYLPILPSQRCCQRR
jgi:hypothetical protein